MSDITSPKVQAGEVNYELHSLGWKAFQNLCLTIMGEVWGQEVQGFYDSHDGGRDGSFHGTWTQENGEPFQGTFTAQCKYTSRSEKKIGFSDLKDDFKKAKRLAARGLAENYFLFTNARLLGSVEEVIRHRFETIAGITRFAAYGVESISQFIRESSRLRMLVPRIYGLGDLSQILDERAYAQVREVLNAYGDDLAKFVITEPYRQSANSLINHGFVLLLGEPACGKSTIAATLAIGGSDKWGCSTVKVRDADDFVKHFNPHEKQFFWVDDAFGNTQIDLGSTSAWNQALPHISAAIHRGSKVLFTSRTYIYRAAKHFLKESALPIINESQVVIHVENLTRDERESILYNHIRLGTQPRSFKTEVKPFLPEVATQNSFSPEIARRLGNPLFTKDLIVSKHGLHKFVAFPIQFLREVIDKLDAGSRSALALVFMRGGKLLSPVHMTKAEDQAISRLGSSTADVLNALKSLDGSLLRFSSQDSEFVWSFKHPTIRDAYAEIVAEDREMMDIYLAGAPLDKLMAEVSCGDTGVEGSKVIVPSDLYDGLMARLDSLETDNYDDKQHLHRFLSYRCDREFLQCYIDQHPDFISHLGLESYLYIYFVAELLVRLHVFGLLPESERRRAVAKFKKQAVDDLDSGFLRGEIRGLMTQKEITDILVSVQELRLPDLGSLIDALSYDYDGGEDPDSYFDDIKSSLLDYDNEYKDNEHASGLISDALAQIDSAIHELWSEFPEDRDEEEFFDTPTEKETRDSARSIFDDVDN